MNKTKAQLTKKMMGIYGIRELEPKGLYSLYI